MEDACCCFAVGTNSRAHTVNPTQNPAPPIKTSLRFVFIVCWTDKTPVCSRSLERLLKAEMHPLRQLVLQNDLAMIRHFDPQIFEVEKELYRQTKQLAAREYALLQTVPGIGENLGLTILYEIGDIERFPSVKDFLSYCRLVKGTVASAGKIKGLRGAKLGNRYLRWAFGEAAVIAKRDQFRIRPLAQRLEARMEGNKFKANTVLAIKLARSVYFMLKNKTVFDPDRLVAPLAKN